MMYEVLTTAEKQVMSVLWNSEEGMTLAAIADKLNKTYDKEWKPQTVATYLMRLVHKKFIDTKKAGRRVSYDILVGQEDYRTQEAQQFVEFWNDGSVEDFLKTYYRDQKITDEQIESLKSTLDGLKNR